MTRRKLSWIWHIRQIGLMMLPPTFCFMFGGYIAPWILEKHIEHIYHSKNFQDMVNTFEFY